MCVGWVGYNPFRTAVPFSGQITLTLSSLPPKRNCSSKRVKWWVGGWVGGWGRGVLVNDWVQHCLHQIITSLMHAISTPTIWCFAMYRVVGLSSRLCAFPFFKVKRKSRCVAGALTGPLLDCPAVALGGVILMLRKILRPRNLLIGHFVDRECSDRRSILG